MQNTSKIINFYQYHGKLAAGGQPDESQLSQLKNEGYDVIFNISPSSAQNYLKNEAEIIEKAGLKYFHFPVDCSALEPLHFQGFSAILKSVENRKVFIHCGGNIKTSNLIHMYQVIEKGMDESESMKQLKTIQKPEEKWFDYYRSFGMKGIG